MLLKQPLFPVSQARSPQPVAVPDVGREVELRQRLMLLCIQTGSSLPQVPKDSWDSSDPPELCDVPSSLVHLVGCPHANSTFSQEEFLLLEN